MQGMWVTALNSSRVHSMMRKSLSSTCRAISHVLIATRSGSTGSLTALLVVERRVGIGSSCGCTGLLRLATKQLEVVNVDFGDVALAVAAVSVLPCPDLSLDEQLGALADVLLNNSHQSRVTNNDVVPLGTFRT